MDRQALADLWCEIMQRRAEDFFADRPDRMTSDPRGHGRTPSLGYVGQDYEPGGDVLVGNFPGGGGSASIERPDPEDERLYGGFQRLANASGPAERLEAFDAMSSIWIAIQRRHRIYQNLISHILSAAKRNVGDVAFLNTFPFRCAENRGPTVRMRDAAWQLAVQPQLELLAPSRIFCLGVAAGRALERRYNGKAQVVVFPRSNGDRYLKQETRRLLQSLT